MAQEASARPAAMERRSLFMSRFWPKSRKRAKRRRGERVGPFFRFCKNRKPVDHRLDLAPRCPTGPGDPLAYDFCKSEKKVPPSLLDPSPLPRGSPPRHERVPLLVEP